MGGIFSLIIVKDVEEGREKNNNGGRDENDSIYTWEITDSTSRHKRHHADFSSLEAVSERNVRGETVKTTPQAMPGAETRDAGNNGELATIGIKRKSAQSPNQK